VLGLHFKREFFRFQLKALEIQIKDFMIIILIEKHVNFFFPNLSVFSPYFSSFSSKFLFFCQTQQQFLGIFL